MDDISLSVTGPFGSEMIPRGLYAEDAAEAAGIFGRVMSGEEELLDCLGSHLSAPLPAALGAAISMLVERARRTAGHPPAPEVSFGSTLDAAGFVRDQMQHEFGSVLPSTAAYRAYEQWFRSQATGGSGPRPVGIRQFVRVMSQRFERVTTLRGLHFVDCALPHDAVAETGVAADATREDRA